jgi:hypothetical protein
MVMAVGELWLMSTALSLAAELELDFESEFVLIKTAAKSKCAPFESKAHGSCQSL